MKRNLSIQYFLLTVFLLYLFRRRWFIVELAAMVFGAGCLIQKIAEKKLCD